MEEQKRSGFRYQYSNYQIESLLSQLADEATSRP
jgi:hypothetical protein